MCDPFLPHEMFVEIFFILQVLIAWYSYKKKRCHKQQRFVMAIEKRRLRLLQNGASQWLRVAGAMADMRARFASLQQVQVIFA